MSQKTVEDPCEYWNCKWLDTKLKSGRCPGFGKHPDFTIDCYADMKIDQKDGMRVKKILAEREMQGKSNAGA